MEFKTNWRLWRPLAGATGSFWRLLAASGGFSEAKIIENAQEFKANWRLWRPLAGASGGFGWYFWRLLEASSVKGISSLDRMV